MVFDFGRTPGEHIYKFRCHLQEGWRKEVVRMAEKKRRFLTPFGKKGEELTDPGTPMTGVVTEKIGARSLGGIPEPEPAQPGFVPIVTDPTPVGAVSSTDPTEPLDAVPVDAGSGNGGDTAAATASPVSTAIPSTAAARPTTSSTSAPAPAHAAATRREAPDGGYTLELRIGADSADGLKRAIADLSGQLALESPKPAYKFAVAFLKDNGELMPWKTACAIFQRHDASSDAELGVKTDPLSVEELDYAVRFMGGVVKDRAIVAIYDSERSTLRPVINEMTKEDQKEFLKKFFASRKGAKN